MPARLGRSLLMAVRFALICPRELFQTWCLSIISHKAVAGPGGLNKQPASALAPKGKAKAKAKGKAKPEAKAKPDPEAASAPLQVILPFQLMISSSTRFALRLRLSEIQESTSRVVAAQPGSTDGRCCSRSVRGTVPPTRRWVRST